MSVHYHQHPEDQEAETQAAGIMRLLPATWSAMPRRLNSSVERYTPLALSE
jgi:hypothetical protein